MNKILITEYVSIWFRRTGCQVEVHLPVTATPSNFAQFDVECRFQGVGIVSFSLHAPDDRELRLKCKEIESALGVWLNALSLQFQTVTFGLS